MQSSKWGQLFTSIVWPKSMIPPSLQLRSQSMILSFIRAHIKFKSITDLAQLKTIISRLPRYGGRYGWGWRWTKRYIQQVGIYWNKSALSFVQLWVWRWTHLGNFTFNKQGYTEINPLQVLCNTEDEDELIRANFTFRKLGYTEINTLWVLYTVSEHYRLLHAHPN
jgi:hypothetical protein